MYNIEERAEEPVGGAARFVSALRALPPGERAAALILFSGDCLNPSLMSAFTLGEQMVPVLNAAGVVAAVAGNHGAPPVRWPAGALHTAAAAAGSRPAGDPDPRITHA